MAGRRLDDLPKPKVTTLSRLKRGDNPAAAAQFGNIVHGVLRACDVPNLLETLPPEEVMVAEAVELSQ